MIKNLQTAFWFSQKFAFKDPIHNKAAAVGVEAGRRTVATFTNMD